GTYRGVLSQYVIRHSFDTQVFHVLNSIKLNQFRHHHLADGWEHRTIILELVEIGAHSNDGLRTITDRGSDKVTLLVVDSNGLVRFTDNEGTFLRFVRTYTWAQSQALQGSNSRWRQVSTVNLVLP